MGGGPGGHVRARLATCFAHATLSRPPHLRDTLSRLFKPHGHLFPSMGLDDDGEGLPSAQQQCEEQPEICWHVSARSMMGMWMGGFIVLMMWHTLLSYCLPKHEMHCPLQVD